MPVVYQQCKLLSTVNQSINMQSYTISRANNFHAANETLATGMYRYVMYMRWN